MKAKQFILSSLFCALLPVCAWAQASTSATDTIVSGSQDCDGRRLPDIEVKDVSAHGSGYPGQDHDIKVHVVNRGQCETGEFTVRLRVVRHVLSKNIKETQLVGIETVASLVPCTSRYCHEASKSVWFTYTLPNDYNAYYEFIVEADYLDNIKEFNEENNKIEGDAEIQVHDAAYYESGDEGE